MNPCSGKAWNALGHIFWKKRDYDQSIKCYEGCLSNESSFDMEKAISYRQLSIVIRSKAAGNMEKLNYSTELAKKSVNLLPQDAESW